MPACVYDARVFVSEQALATPPTPGPVDTSSLVLSPQAVLEDYGVLRGLGTRVLAMVSA